MGCLRNSFIPPKDHELSEKLDTSQVYHVETNWRPEGLFPRYKNDGGADQQRRARMFNNNRNGIKRHEKIQREPDFAAQYV